MQLHTPARRIAAALVLLIASSAGTAFGSSDESDADLGGGGWPPDLAGPELTAQQRRAIENATASSAMRLRLAGKLAPPTETTVLFQWPIAPWNGYPDGQWGISNYVDQDFSNPGFLDYACGQNTYDGHGGTDIFTWPWPWKVMDEEHMAVVAAAPGTIIWKQDGNWDMSCVWAGGDWNAVYVMHADGSIAWYGHMKNGSVTPKPIGADVATGEYLGIVGSSGNSSGPHVHFEVWEDETYSQLLDPYQGACNSLNADSMWVSQRPYAEPKILRMTAGALPPENGNCPHIETPNEQKDFTSGTAIRFTSYYRDHYLGSITSHEVRNPDGSLNTSWFLENTSQDYDASWWWQVQTITGVDGTYTWRATHEGNTTEYQFNLGFASAGSSPAEAAEGEPLLVAKSGGGAVTLSWGESCRASDSDYAIYQGTLGSLPVYDHVKLVCSTGGARQRNIASPAGGDLYWLVTPRNQLREGSLGKSSAGVERPQPAGLQKCLTRMFDCP